MVVALGAGLAHSTRQILGSLGGHLGGLGQAGLCLYWWGWAEVEVEVELQGFHSGCNQHLEVEVEVEVE